MLVPLLIVLQPVAGQDNALSPAMRHLVETRARIPEDDFARQVEVLAMRGDASAAEMAGEGRQFGGIGWSIDQQKACDWFERAAAARGDSAHNLALCHETGKGRPQDLARARALYGQASGLGWVQAKCALGNLLVSGRGGPADVPKGLALCREAAEAGNANAQADYGTFLLIGEVAPRDAVAARRWLTAAAEQNQANAAMLLGQQLWNGDGVPADRDEAARWWKVAYDHDRKDAAALLARAAFRRAVHDGKIVDRSAVSDYIHWLQVAAREDPDPAQRASFAAILSDMAKPE